MLPLSYGAGIAPRSPARYSFPAFSSRTSYGGSHRQASPGLGRGFACLGLRSVRRCARRCSFRRLRSPSL